MKDAAKKKLAQKAYRTLLLAFEKNGWACTRYDDNLAVKLGVKGNSADLVFSIVIDADRQLVRLISRLPVTFTGSKIMIGAIAVGVANHSLSDGSFDLNVLKGEVYFKITTSFYSCEVTPSSIKYLINCATYSINKFSDEFAALNGGTGRLTDFVQNHSRPNGG
ncbi:MAG: hypothetical protein K2L72_01840 [Clostridia bacterium]|nr:hypothetical protein [Clostridia bacterium]